MSKKKKLNKEPKWVLDARRNAYMPERLEGESLGEYCARTAVESKKVHIPGYRKAW